MSHSCIYCKKATTKVILANSRYYMKCESCDVNYRIVRDKCLGFSIPRVYNGDRYVYRYVTRFYGLHIESKMILSRCNKGAKSVGDYYKDICKVEPCTINPKNALDKIPDFLNNKAIQLG